jgi:hypothetical protein
MTYAERVCELEQEGLTTSDAQGVADAEVRSGRAFAFDADHPNDPHGSEPVELSWDDVPVEFSSPVMFDSGVAGEEARARFRAWCAERGVFYYARPRESFSSTEAARLAREGGFRAILLDDMS